VVKISAFIQARTGSTRFPNKVHAKLGGKDLINWIVEAAWAIKGVSDVRVLWAEEYPHLLGTLPNKRNDVLRRYREALDAHPCDAVVRLTADCPLLSVSASSLVVKAFTQESGISYASNIFPKRTWPDGLDTEVISAGMIRLADERATDPHDREHVTPWIQRYVLHRNTYARVELPVDWSTVRLTVDTPEDLEWLETAIRSPRSGSLVPAASPQGVLRRLARWRTVSRRERIPRS
jgi:spore coat polysaccharide biosynthesis protein SpsF